MPEDVTEELGRVARGGAIALVGLMISAVFGFLVRALVGRVYGPKQYGTYNLAFTVFTVTLTAVVMGLPIGMQREVSYFRHKRPNEVEDLISTTLLTVLMTSILGLITLELVKCYLPSYIGGGSLLPKLLEILALSLPLSAISKVSVAVSQGFGRVREYFLYGMTFLPTLYFTLSLIVVVEGGSLITVILAYVLSQAVAFTLILRDLRRFNLIPRKPRYSPKLALVIVTFSLPLLFSSMVGFVMSWTDTLMLGHYLGSKIVGIYNAAAPLSRFIPVFLAAFTAIYSPIATGLFAQERIKELNEFYTTVTKWVVLLTFPLFFVLVSYPSQVITFLFGAKYVDAWKPLVILSVGFMFHTIVGPNGLTIICMGKPSRELLGNTLGATLNVILNVLLIPLYGMSGAAIATATSYVVANTYKSTWLAKRGIIPFNARYGKIIIAGSVAMILGRLLSASGIVEAILWTAIVSVIFYVSTLLLGTYDQEDVELLRMASKKFGLKIELVIRIIKRFIR